MKRVACTWDCQVSNRCFGRKRCWKCGEEQCECDLDGDGLCRNCSDDETEDGGDTCSSS